MGACVSMAGSQISCKDAFGLFDTEKRKMSGDQAPKVRKDCIRDVSIAAAPPPPPPKVSVKCGNGNKNSRRSTKVVHYSQQEILHPSKENVASQNVSVSASRNTSDDEVQQFKGKLALMRRVYDWQDIPLDFFIDAHVTIEDTGRKPKRSGLSKQSSKKKQDFAQPA